MTDSLANLKKGKRLMSRVKTCKKEDLAKYLAFLLGYEGKTGGWIYDKNNNVVAQGWSALAFNFQNKKWIFSYKFKDHENNEKERFIIDWKNIPRDLII